MIKWDVSQDCKNSSICENQSVILHINKLKVKNHLITSINVQNDFDKLQCPFMIKTFHKMSIEGTHLNIIKVIYSTPIVNIILSGENQKVFPLRSETREGCLFSPLQHSFGNPSHSNQRRKKKNPDWKGKRKTLPVYRHHISILIAQLVKNLPAMQETPG